MSLHRQIMNLPDNVDAGAESDAFCRGYKYGHRDARHAAAELTLSADAEIERLRDALAIESSRKCASEHDCIWQPHCSHAGKCMRPERPMP
jgi:hypothetical protein